MTKNSKITGRKSMDFTQTLDFCNNKIIYYKDLITSTILAVQRYKSMDIIKASDMNICIQNLENLYKQLNIIENNLSYNIKKKNKKEFEDIINILQKINNELSALFRTTGTNRI